METVLLVILGLITGTLSGFFGIGGGVVLVPGLIYILHVEPEKAVATSLAVIIPTAIIGSLKHFSLGNTDVNLALIIAIGGAIGALFGTALCSHFSSSILTKSFGVLLIVVGINLFFGSGSSNSPLQ